MHRKWAKALLKRVSNKKGSENQVYIATEPFFTTQYINDVMYFPEEITMHCDS